MLAIFRNVDSTLPLTLSICFFLCSHIHFPQIPFLDINKHQNIKNAG